MTRNQRIYAPRKQSVIYSTIYLPIPVWLILALAFTAGMCMAIAHADHRNAVMVEGVDRG